MASPPATEAPAGIARSQAIWLLCASVSVALPLVVKLPAPLAAACGALLGWAAWIWVAGRRLPPRRLLVALVALATVAIGLTYRSLLGREPGVAMLLAFLALKLLELRGVRDGHTVGLLCYFMQLALLFDRQGPGMAAYVAASLTLVTAALIHLERDGQSPRATVERALVMTAQALPLMLVFFVLFPRVQGPLWGLPKDAWSGMSGLSETMTPGSIGELSLSGATAFRVRFSGQPPAHADLYWRGPVLTHFDGRTWRAGSRATYERVPWQAEGASLDYVVTLEPHNKPWLFALDVPGVIPDAAVITSELQLLARTPVRSRILYPMRSYPGMSAGVSETDAVLAAARRLPAASNPRSRALAQRLRAGSADDAGVIAQALAHFRNEPFVYTLSPPVLGEDPIDGFLFDSRRGFCEHYAGAFVFLMRAAGIPARVVTGYQGGEVNPVDGYLLVRQSDAHAWVEVWLAGRGWTRVDPTAAVAPSRIESGIAAAVPAGDPLPFLIRAELDWLRPLRFRWEALATAWDNWIIGYDAARQRELFGRIGMDGGDRRFAAGVLAVLVAAILAAFGAWALHERARQDPVLRAWSAFSRKMSRRGLARMPHEGPVDYARRICAAEPGLAPEAGQLAMLYARLRYGSSRDGEREFIRRVREFRLRT
ncbi:MAG: protein-glutamine gamma-glutamyltransferase TgpA [Rhodocyclaceae bacterium]